MTHVTCSIPDGDSALLPGGHCYHGLRDAHALVIHVDNGTIGCSPAKPRTKPGWNCIELKCLPQIPFTLYYINLNAIFKS